MALICPAYRLLYIQVPSTGCSVVSEVLRERLGGKDLGRKHNDVAELLHQGLLSEEELRGYLVVANVRNPFDLLVTYYQRLTGSWANEFSDWKRRDLKRGLESGQLSHAAHAARLAEHERRMARLRRQAAAARLVGFNAWVQITALRGWWKRGSLTGGESQLDGWLLPQLADAHVALRQERLEEALNEILARIGYDTPVELPRANVTPGKRPYPSYYSMMSRRIVSRLHRRELRRLGYTFEGPMDEDPVIDLEGDSRPKRR